MKSGGQNPFADETEQSEEQEEETSNTDQSDQSEERGDVVSNTGNTGQSDQPKERVDVGGSTGNTGQSDQSKKQKEEISNTEQTTPVEEGNQTPSGSNTGQFDRSDLPRMVVRNSVKEDRDGGVHQLFVYQDTENKEKQARRDLEDRFDEDLYKLDAREAIYLAGMQNLDDAENILREWGMDF